MTNLQTDPIRPHGATPGRGGTLVPPNIVAITLPGPQTAEAWRAADDNEKLGLASPDDLKRLDAEAKRLAKAEEAVATAERGHDRAREALVAQRVAGRPVAKAEEQLRSAEHALAEAQRDLSLTRDVHAALRAKIIESVRAELVSGARARLAAIHSAYDDAVAVVVQGQRAAATLSGFVEREAEAAAALADAEGMVPGFEGGERMAKATGRAHRTIPAEYVRGLVTLIERPPEDPLRLDANLAASQLARRTGAVQEERPRLRRIDE